MTKPVSATKTGLKPHYKVRIVLLGVVLHLASTTQPRITRELAYGSIVNVQADWIDDPRYGDTFGHIDWPAVKAITWRWSE
jgi:hypothetical protein